MRKLLIATTTLASLLASSAMGASPASIDNNDNWRLITQTDHMDDSEIVVLSNTSLDRLGYRNPDLLIRCMKGHTDVMLLGLPYMTDENQLVKMRFDKEEVHQRMWAVGESNTTLFFDGGDGDIVFANMMLQHHTLYLQWDNKYDGQQEVGFNLDNLVSHIAVVRDACKWK